MLSILLDSYCFSKKANHWNSVICWTDAFFSYSKSKVGVHQWAKFSGLHNRFSVNAFIFWLTPNPFTHQNLLLIKAANVQIAAFFNGSHYLYSSRQFHAYISLIKFPSVTRFILLLSFIFHKCLSYLLGVWNERLHFISLVTNTQVPACICKLWTLCYRVCWGVWMTLLQSATADITPCLYYIRSH